MLIADATWYLISRHVKDNHEKRSRGGFIDAVEASTAEEAIDLAKTRNPVRPSEFLEAYPVSDQYYYRAESLNKKRTEEIEGFAELMEAEDANEHDGTIRESRTGDEGS